MGKRADAQRERRHARIKERLRKKAERKAARLGTKGPEPAPPPKPKPEPNKWSTAPQAASETKALSSPVTSTKAGAAHPDRPGLVVIGKYKNKSGKPKYGTKAEYAKRNK